MANKLSYLSRIIVKNWDNGKRTRMNDEDDEEWTRKTNWDDEAHSQSKGISMLAPNQKG